MTNQTTGTLHTEDRTLRSVLPPLCASVLAAAALTAAAVPLLFPLLGRYGPVPLDGQAQGAAAAILAYVLFRILYPRASRLFPGRGTRRVPWTVTEDALSIGGRTVARDSIKNIHIWPNRDALGHALPGWTVNIETTGRNLLLRAPGQSGGGHGDNRDGGEELQTLVRALGYGDRWPGE